MLHRSSYALVLTMVLALLCSAAAQSPTGAVRGKVKEYGGKALEGVKVLARKIEARQTTDQSSNRASSRAARAADSADKRETATNGKGEFAFTDLAPGNYALTFEKQGFVTITTWQMEIKSSETVQLGRPVELPREKQSETSLIRGAVLNQEGFSIPDVAVKIERTNGGRKFKKESNSTEGGKFEFSVPSEKATYRITASASGFQTVTKEIEVDPAEIRQVVLTLEKKP